MSGDGAWLLAMLHPDGGPVYTHTATVDVPTMWRWYELRRHLNPNSARLARSHKRRRG